MTIAMLVAVWTGFAVATIGFAVPSHANIFSAQFQSPSGNISCNLIYYPPRVARLPPGGNSAQCDIDEREWEAPRPPPADGADYTTTFLLNSGDAPMLGYTQGGFAAAGPVLDYGQMQSAGTITCVSEESGMRCADASTGHFFRVSDLSYDLQ